MKIMRALGMGVLLTLSLSTSFAEEPERPRGGREGNLKPGDVAPEFVVKDMSGKKEIELAGLKGKPVVLFFGSCT